MSTNDARDVLQSAGLYGRDKALLEESLCVLHRHGLLFAESDAPRVMWGRIMVKAVELFDNVDDDIVNGQIEFLLYAAEVIAETFDLGEQCVEWTAWWLSAWEGPRFGPVRQGFSYTLQPSGEEDALREFYAPLWELFTGEHRWVDDEQERR